MSTLNDILPIEWQHSKLGIARRRAWHPDMSCYMLGERHGLIVSSSIRYRRSLLRAIRVVQEILSNGGHVWIVNTSPALAPIVEGLTNLVRNSVSYSSYAWTPGTLTNWHSVSRSVLSYGMFEQKCGKMLRDDSLEFPRYRRVRRHFKGLISDNGLPAPLPDLIIMTNPGANFRIVEEASRMHIPIIGFVESDTKLKGITYPISMNLQNIQHVYKTLQMILSVVPRK